MIPPWIRESNLIEGINSPEEDTRSASAWKWFVTQKLNVSSILKLHKRITWKQLGSEHAGRFRTCQVWVGGREGAPWQLVPEKVANWVYAYVPAPTEERIKQAHIVFEKIHPFIDGNGRTGRMIMNWQRITLGLEPLLLEARKRGFYYEWFR